ncbi:MAG: MFS transporter [Actinobacteria bacterium]|nr:MFS transporter [Actinomycetota bacterium]
MIADSAPHDLGDGSRQRIPFGVVLAIAMSAASFPGFAFGALGPFLVDEFEISRSQLGLLTTLFFAVGGVLSLVAGPMVDRFGGRRVMLGAFGIIGLALLAMAGAPSYPTLLFAAAFGALSIATANPTTNKLVAVHVPPGQRGVIMGVKQSGVQIGAFAAGAILAPLAAWFGWRLALMLTASVPLLGALGALLFVPSDETDTSSRGSTDERHAPMTSAVWWLTTYAFLMGSGVSAVTAYLPLYAVERLDFSVPTAGAVAAVIGLVGIVGRVTWGLISERRSGFVTPLLVMAIGAVASVLLLMAAEESSALIWLGALLLGATAVTWNSVGMLAVIVLTGPAAAGRASGYVLFGFYGGFVGSPLLFGTIVDNTERYDIAWTIVAAIFVLAAGVIGAWQRSASPPSREVIG